MHNPWGQCAPPLIPEDGLLPSCLLVSDRHLGVLLSRLFGPPKPFQHAISQLQNSLRREGGMVALP